MSLIVSWHPTFALFRQPYEWGAFEADLQRFHRLIKNQLEPGPELILTNPTSEDVQKLCSGVPWVTVDIETAPETKEQGWTGKDPTRARLKSVGLGTCTWGLSHWWEGGKRVEATIKQILEDPRIVKVFHNGPWFDLRVLARYGIEVANWEDTRDLRRALSATSQLSLRYLGSLYTDFEPWKEGDSDDAKGLVFTDDREKLKRYNALDCVVTARVWRGLQSEPEVNDERVQQLYKTHKQLSIIAAEMHNAGFMVDAGERARLSKVLTYLKDRKVRKLLKLVGIPGFTVTPNNMRRLLFKRYETSQVNRFHLQDPLDKRCYTETGLISVDFDSLLMLVTEPGAPKDLIEIIETYWAAESYKKARSTFVASQLVEQAIGPDGRCRPGWNSCGTDTGRWSCSEPNVMNLEQYLRRMYRAAPGHVLVHADYSQLELRVMAAVSGDDELQRRLDAGDVYSADAKDWFKLPKDMDVKKLKPRARQQAKIIHLASQYAAGTETVFFQALSQDRSIKYTAVQLLHEGFKTTYARTVQYWFEELNRVRQCGYSESRIMHRRRVYPREPPITEVANYPIQSTAGDVANMAMIAIREKLRKYAPNSRLLVQLHDAFDVEAPEKEAKVVEDIMRECMEAPVEIDGKVYRLPVEIKTATHWHKV